MRLDLETSKLKVDVYRFFDSPSFWRVHAEIDAGTPQRVVGSFFCDAATLADVRTAYLGILASAFCATASELEFASDRFRLACARYLARKTTDTREDTAKMLAALTPIEAEIRALFPEQPPEPKCA